MVGIVKGRGMCCTGEAWVLGVHVGMYVDGVGAQIGLALGALALGARARAGCHAELGFRAPGPQQVASGASGIHSNGRKLKGLYVEACGAWVLCVWVGCAS
eukprot:evm.model.scf_1827.5 EVM.evm.TU.scf_1827.5   scf_1827:27888-28190(-)